VWGLDACSHKAIVRDFIVLESVSLVCLQETKLDVISGLDVMDLLGQGFDYVYLSTDHSHRGILVTWRRDYWVVSSTSLHEFPISIRLLQSSFSEEWWLMTVYGPPIRPLMLL
jgi:hypothetical protein